MFAYLDDRLFVVLVKKNIIRIYKTIEIAKSYNMTLNKDKCVFSRETFRLLGYEMTQNKLCLDPTCFKPLRNMPVHTSKENFSYVGYFCLLF